MHQAAVLMQSPPWLEAWGRTCITLDPAKIPVKLFQHVSAWVRRAGKKWGKARVIDGTQGPEIVYDANMFKSTVLPPLGKGA